jgi:hypothetical protein
MPLAQTPSVSRCSRPYSTAEATAAATVFQLTQKSLATYFQASGCA